MLHPSNRILDFYSDIAHCHELSGKESDATNTKIAWLKQHQNQKAMHSIKNKTKMSNIMAPPNSNKVCATWRDGWRMRHCQVGILYYACRRYIYWHWQNSRVKSCHNSLSQSSYVYSGEAYTSSFKIFYAAASYNKTSVYMFLFCFLQWLKQNNHLQIISPF